MHIAVVGAGPAGLTAAHRLRQAGHRVEVLEARDMIGGRTHAEHFGPGHHCDTGAPELSSTAAASWSNALRRVSA